MALPSNRSAWQLCVFPLAFVAVHERDHADVTNRRSPSRAAHERSSDLVDISRMKAIVHETYGSPDVLQLREVPKPVVDADSVLVRVRAASRQCR